MSRSAVIIVNYRTPELAIACLKSLRDQILAEADCRVLVVDNASGDGSAERLSTEVGGGGWNGRAKLLVSARNTGFAGGNNTALRYLRACTPALDYVIFLNPDTVAGPGALRALLSFMERSPRVGIAGGASEDQHGVTRRTAFRFHTIGGELERTVRAGPVSRLLARWQVAPPSRSEAHATDWVAGCSMIVRTEVFDSVGLLDERYFLYFEETDFCLHARQRGWECWYVPQSRITHLIGRSTGINRPEQPPARLPRYWFESRNYYFRKNHGRLYSALANFACLAGLLIYRARCRLTGRPDADPPFLLTDFLRSFFSLPPETRQPEAPAGGCSGSDRQQREQHPRHGDRNGNPPGIGLWALLREDLRTHDGAIFEQGFWAVAVHRFGNWRMGIRWMPLRIPFSALYFFLYKGVQWTCGITLHYNYFLGRRVRLWHHSGMILGAYAIGDDCHIRQNTSFGVAQRVEAAGKPIIEDRVDIGAGVCILGEVRIGHDSVIGANSVVLTDIPPYSVAVGAPARVVKTLAPGQVCPVEEAA